MYMFLCLCLVFVFLHWLIRSLRCSMYVCVPHTYRGNNEHFLSRLKRSFLLCHSLGKRQKVRGFSTTTQNQALYFYISLYIYIYGIKILWPSKEHALLMSRVFGSHPLWVSPTQRNTCTSFFTFTFESV